jgi:predicted RNase H-like nuclease
VDLAWQSEKNPSAIAYGTLQDCELEVTTVNPAVFGIDSVLYNLTAVGSLRGIAIDAPLIIKNVSGQRACETGIGRQYGSRHASCHTSNTKLYPSARSVYLSEKLSESGFQHLVGSKWQMECYPHPAIIEMFNLPERLRYKKGTVAAKKAGQQELARLLKSLSTSEILKLVVSDDVAHVLDENHISSLAGQRLKSNEDALDAIVCLYIAGLYSMEVDGELFGDDKAGYIWVPQRKCTTNASH